MESENQMLKHQVSELKRLNISNLNDQEELEQYWRRLCLQIDGVLTKTSESSDDVLNSVKSSFKPAKVDISETFNDRNYIIESKIFRRFLKQLLQKYNHTFYYIPPHSFVLQSQK